MRSIYLVGINHKYQVNPADCYLPNGVSTDDSAEFCQMLRTVIQHHNIKGIAEEMNADGLRIGLGVDLARAEWQLPEFQDLPEPVERDSIGFNLAKDLGLFHRYCDPDLETREARNIKKPKDKEPYWIEQLWNFEGFPALFILGADHVSSFTSLLKESGFQSFIFAADWEPAAERDGSTQYLPVD
jgi:hypothetical protein